MTVYHFLVGDRAKTSSPVKSGSYKATQAGFPNKSAICSLALLRLDMSAIA